MSPIVSAAECSAEDGGPGAGYGDLALAGGRIDARNNAGDTSSGDDALRQRRKQERQVVREIDRLRRSIDRQNSLMEFKAGDGDGTGSNVSRVWIPSALYVLHASKCTWYVP